MVTLKKIMIVQLILGVTRVAVSATQESDLVGFWTKGNSSILVGNVL